MNKSVLFYLCYKKFLKDQVKAGHSIKDIEFFLNYKSSSISKILNNNNTLPIDKAFELTKFLGLTNKETDYLILLVQYGDAGSVKLKEYFRAKIHSFFIKNFYLSHPIFINELDKKWKLNHWTKMMDLLKKEEVKYIHDNIQPTASKLSKEHHLYHCSWRRKALGHIERFDGRSTRSIYTMQTIMSEETLHEIYVLYALKMENIKTIIENDQEGYKSAYNLNLDLYNAITF